MAKPKLQSLVIVGKRWFDRRYGNTYCSAMVFGDGKLIAETGVQYGYEEYYMQAAVEQLIKEGWLPEKETNGKADWRHLNDSGVEWSSCVCDVTRKCDL